MYALVSSFCAAVFSGLGRGQAHTVYGAAQEAPKANRLRGAGALRHRFDNARPSGAPQGHAGVVG